MMDGAFRRLLDRYGQTVSLHYGAGVAGTPSRGFLQPVLERREDWRQALPTPLGTVRRDRFLYLGEPEAPLDGLEGGYLLCRGVRYDVQDCQAVYVGERLSHWWAVLTVRDREEDGAV